MKYLFGPVNSRRLGISLGIDLVPYKTCTLNCVYCECGKTTNLTSQVDEYFPSREVISEIDEFLYNSPDLDVITFSGSGEPTLHSGIGDIIEYLKRKYPQYSIAILTNGTLLWKRDIRASIKDADIVIPSLDAVSLDIFNRLCRPADGISPERVVDGLISFRKEFNGKIIMEIFIVPGQNDNISELKKLKKALVKIEPDLIQINSLDRPGTEEWVSPVKVDDLEYIKEFFCPLNIEIVGQPEDKCFISKNRNDIIESILSILRRRPSTIDDLHQSLGMKRVEILKTISSMIREGTITVEKLERGEFYRIV